MSGTSLTNPWQADQLGCGAVFWTGPFAPGVDTCTYDLLNYPLIFIPLQGLDASWPYDVEGFEKSGDSPDTRRYGHVF